ncbi:MAG: four helix bundle protein [Balneola sp.]|jgi:four helix bundle protein|nr:four helix bundle protein [Balneola sp.]MBE78048.1 four helix bundle protein [Balneola sp.]|tara:strand:- start:100 stop:468 length:369 start_codon:yes stop_codon:yes gene_type:complete
MKSYTDLDIYKMAYELALEVHKLTMTLPKYEMYEQGSQVRRSLKSIKDNIAEGYGRRRYKDEFIRFLIFANSSCDETVSQLNMISDIHFKENPLTDLLNRYDILGRKINSFINYVETSWKIN